MILKSRCGLNIEIKAGGGEKVNSDNKNKVAEIIRNYEDAVGIKFESAKMKEFVNWLERKCELSGHDESYMPVLAKYELPMQVQGLVINDISKQLRKGVNAENENCGRENTCG